MPSRLSLLGAGGEIYTTIKSNLGEKDPVATTENNIILFPFTFGYWMFFFWERYFLSLKENMLKYTKKLLHCTLYLYSSGWKKMQVNLSSLNNVCKPTRSKINRQQLWCRHD